jgi:hypothetical protein
MRLFSKLSKDVMAFSGRCMGSEAERNRSDDAPWPVSSAGDS